MREALLKVMEMYKTKGIGTGYQVYHSGFGSDESYFMVAVSGKNSLAIATMDEENNALLGEEKNALLWNVIKVAYKYDQVEATVRPDLSYYPSQQK